VIPICACASNCCFACSGSSDSPRFDVHRYIAEADACNHAYAIPDCGRASGIPWLWPAIGTDGPEAFTVEEAFADHFSDLVTVLGWSAASLKERERDDRDDEIARLKSKVGEITMDNELLCAKIDALEGKRPLAHRRSRR
jgi:hypothetical protein